MHLVFFRSGDRFYLNQCRFHAAQGKRGIAHPHRNRIALRKRFRHHPHLLAGGKAEFEQAHPDRLLLGPVRCLQAEHRSPLALF